MPVWEYDRLQKNQGFGLIELMMALLILTFGLLAAGQLLYTTAGMGSLARSQSTAAVAAQTTLEHLSNLYQNNPSAEELAPGPHGPMHTQVINPADGSVLHRYAVTWIAGDIPDPRPGKALKGRTLRVEVRPMQSEARESARSMFHKRLTVATLFSTRMR